MPRRNFRAFLALAVVISAVFASWSWFRPYSWGADPAARCRVVGTQVKSDRSYFWVDVHLKVLPGQTHDLMKPTRLVTASGREIEPADTTLGGSGDAGTSDLWLKFWLESADAEGPLKLMINDGALIIRSRNGLPSLGSRGIKYFVTANW
jgi:hypothetical protein